MQRTVNRGTVRITNGNPERIKEGRADRELDGEMR